LRLSAPSKDLDDMHVYVYKMFSLGNVLLILLERKIFYFLFTNYFLKKSNTYLEISQTMI